MNPHGWHPCHARVLMLGSLSVELQRFQLVVQDGRGTGSSSFRAFDGRGAAARSAYLTSGSGIVRPTTVSARRSAYRGSCVHALALGPTDGRGLGEPGVPAMIEDQTLHVRTAVGAPEIWRIEYSIGEPWRLSLVDPYGPR